MYKEMGFKINYDQLIFLTMMQEGEIKKKKKTMTANRWA